MSSVETSEFGGGTRRERRDAGLFLERKLYEQGHKPGERVKAEDLERVIDEYGSEFLEEHPGLEDEVVDFYREQADDTVYDYGVGNLMREALGSVSGLKVPASDGGELEADGGAVEDELDAGETFTVEAGPGKSLLMAGMAVAAAGGVGYLLMDTDNDGQQGYEEVIEVIGGGSSSAAYNESTTSTVDTVTTTTSPSTTTSTTPTSTTTTIDPHSVDDDGDGLSLVLERDIGTSDNSPNERISGIADYLEGDLTEEEKKLLKLIEENPHNIWPQIQNASVYEDGTVTGQEYRNMTDRDGDGLIRMNELRSGTDLGNRDTDKDGLPDGWEWADGVVIDGNYVPLNNSDPMHKDIYLRIIPIDGDLKTKLGDKATDNTKIFSSEEARSNLISNFNRANISNPDGEEGITLHISYQRDNLDKFRGGIGPSEFPEQANHPYFGAYYFSLLDSEELGDAASGTSYSPGSVNWVDPVPGDYRNTSDLSAYHPHKVLHVELLHNIVGKLDKEIRSDRSPYYPEEGRFRISNDAVSSEIERDGILGLPNTGSTMRNIEWDSSIWHMPDNTTDQ